MKPTFPCAAKSLTNLEDRARGGPTKRPRWPQTPWHPARWAKANTPRCVAVRRRLGCGRLETWNVPPANRPRHTPRYSCRWIGSGRDPSTAKEWVARVRWPNPHPTPRRSGSRQISAPRLGSANQRVPCTTPPWARPKGPAVQTPPDNPAGSGRSTRLSPHRHPPPSMPSGWSNPEDGHRSHVCLAPTARGPDEPAGDGSPPTAPSAGCWRCATMRPPQNPKTEGPLRPCPPLQETKPDRFLPRATLPLRHRIDTSAAPEADFPEPIDGRRSPPRHARPTHRCEIPPSPRHPTWPVGPARAPSQHRGDLQLQWEPPPVSCPKIVR